MGAQANIEVAPSAPKKVAKQVFLRLERLQNSLVLPTVLLNGATFLQMPRKGSSRKCRSRNDIEKQRGTLSVLCGLDRNLTVLVNFMQQR